MADLEKIKMIALKYGWRFIQWQDNIKMISFKKDQIRINIYVTKMTVATAMSHSKHGKTQMFRRHVSLNLLERIFMNPRIHTKKGYFLRKDRI